MYVHLSLLLINSSKHSQDTQFSHVHTSSDAMQGVITVITVTHVSHIHRMTPGSGQKLQLV